MAAPLMNVWKSLKPGRSIISSTSQQSRWFGQPAAQTHPHLLQHGQVTPGISQAEYKTRRKSLMKSLSDSSHGIKMKNHNHIVIIPSAQKVFMTHDIHYPFRQNTDFLYMCGFQEPNSVLILESKESSDLSECKSTLFVPKKDPHKELWEGTRSGVLGAVELTGVDKAYNTEEMEGYLHSYLRDHKNFMVWYDCDKPTHMDFHSRYLSNFIQQNKSGYIEKVRNKIQLLRLIKSPDEIALMRKTCAIASEAFKELMKFSHPEINEAHLYAKMDYECRINGAECLAYPPVVAGGNRANTIHYISNNQIIENGDMVLMDAGCECHGYNSDITRTWPINGSFTSAQRELYEAVLEVQKSCVKLSTCDMTIEKIFTEMLRLLGKQLESLGISSKTTKGSQRLAREFCAHHVGHYLGMDVHDTDDITRNKTLAPGMVITIEPGMYIDENRTDVLKDFRGIGIRIEDDVLITEDRPDVLTAKCPKEIYEIEELMKNR